MSYFEFTTLVCTLVDTSLNVAKALISWKGRKDRAKQSTTMAPPMCMVVPMRPVDDLPWMRRQ